MAAIIYQVNRFEFERGYSDPFSEDEYNRAKKDFYNFYHDHIDWADNEFKKLKNPHAFKWTSVLIKLGCGFLFVGIDLGLKEFGYYDAGEVFAVLSAIPFAWIVIQPIQWMLSASASSSFSNYEKHARDYYLFQHRKMKRAISYHDYKVMVSESTLIEFMKFDWEDEAAVISEHVSPVEN
jgi:hypothetical protein